MYFHSFRDFASTETIDTSALATKKERLDNLDQANAEVEKLRKLAEKLTGELQGELYFIYVFLAIILHLKFLETFRFLVTKVMKCRVETVAVMLLRLN